MSLVLRYGEKGTDTCKAIYAFDATGDSAITGGWSNGGNPSTANATSATFTLTGLVSGLTKTINVYPTLPFAEPNVLTPTTLVAIQNTDLGLSADQNIPSDVWSGTYTVVVNVSGTVTTYSDTHYFYNSCSHDCCLQKLRLKMETCGCGSEAISAMEMKAVSIKLRIRGIKTAIKPNCNNIAGAIAMVKKLNSICKSENCNCF